MSVFHQLGYCNPDELVIKSELIDSIGQLLKARGLTQQQAAEVLGMPRPEVSLLMNGKISRFSIERLVRAHNALEPEIRLHITREPLIV
jgi:predicted XRE-type DNA-binding protein